MKAEHRHELKTNELAQWLANLPQWTKQNIRTICYVSIVIVIAAAAILLKWHYGSTANTQEKIEYTNNLIKIRFIKNRVLADLSQGTDSSFNLLQLATELHDCAQTTENDTMAALAMIKQAEALRTEPHYRTGTVNKKELLSQLNDAQDLYTQAYNKAKDNLTIMAEAKLGQGLCEEEKENYQKAKQIYQELVNDEKLKPTTTAAAASLRLKTIDEYEQKIVFKPAAKPQPTKITMPEILLDDSDANTTGQIQPHSQP